MAEMICRKISSVAWESSSFLVAASDPMNRNKTTKGHKVRILVALMLEQG
jgi:hypothetical protein